MTPFIRNIFLLKFQIIPYKDNIVQYSNKFIEMLKKWKNYQEKPFSSFLSGISDMLIRLFDKKTAILTEVKESNLGKV